MNDEQKSEVHEIVTLRLRPLEVAQADTAKVLSRLVTAVTGDPQYKRPGLVDTVEEHDRIINGWNDTMKSNSGALKASLWIGGTIVTFLNIAIQVYGVTNGR
jgi:hypothetical protein